MTTHAPQHDVEPRTFTFDIKRNFIDRRVKKLVISPERLEFAGDSMLISRISDIRYGSIQQVVNGIKAGKTYEIVFRSQDKKVIKIFFGSASIMKTNKSLDDHYNAILSGVWVNILSGMVNRTISEIRNGKNFTAGGCEVSRTGMKLTTYKWFKKKEIFVEWKDCVKSYVNGEIHLWSKNDEKRKCTISLLNIWNAVVLASMLDFLFKEGRVFSMFDVSP